MKIDIVILWVDGNDVNWLKQKKFYMKKEKRGDSNVNRFRDMETLKYLFRGIERYASWVNNIFFITWGHIPVWLNQSNKKIKIIKHEDFIPKEYLPTFNSNVIEMNLHRIKELSSYFILFNDDLLILRNLKPNYFFKNGLPNDFYIEYKKKSSSKRHKNMKNNYLEIINKYFDKQIFVAKHFRKIFNIKYGFKNFRNFYMCKRKKYEDFYNQHLTQAFLKETFDIVWSKEKERLDLACLNRFRDDNDIGVQLCRYWQLLSGNFEPYREIGKYFEITNNNKKIISAIKRRRYKVICINDANIQVDFEKAKKEIKSSLEFIFNEKCSFEI